MTRNNIAMKLSICILNFSLNTEIFDELRKNVQYTYSRTARKWPKKNVIKYSGNSRELETKKEEKTKNVREK